MQNTSSSDLVEVGVDEAGRGCLVGRVYTAAVILPEEYPDETYLQINDSKKLSPAKRNELRKYNQDFTLTYFILLNKNK
jgi:ribonuclease HII